MPSSRSLLPNIFNKTAVFDAGNSVAFNASLPMPRQPSSENGIIGSPLNTTTFKPGMIRPM